MTWGTDGDVLYTRRLPYEIYSFTLSGAENWVVTAPFAFDRGEGRRMGN